MTKLTIAVLFGGCSNEHAVSLASAYHVITQLDKRKYEPVLLGITPDGEWFRFFGPPESIRDNVWQNERDCTKAIISPDRITHGVIELAADCIRTTRLDAALPVLHGKNGEDGTVQGLLELAGIPIVGCDTLCSALCMDKDRAHRIAHMAGVRVPHSFTLERGYEAKAVEGRAGELGYPLFVKPVRSGSSYGISKVFNLEGLSSAIELAFSHDSRVIVEENIQGFEVDCAILGTDDLILGELGEIELADGFFDYEEKYSARTYTYHVPARISQAKATEVKETAKRIYKALGCSGFARVDMFLTPLGELVFNEVNTIPGFTKNSHYPRMLEAADISFSDMLDKAIELAVRA